MKTLVLILFTSICFGQGFNPYDVTDVLGDIHDDWSFGNECGVDNFMNSNVIGGMNMNGHTLQLLNISLTVDWIENEGLVVYSCEQAELIITGTLDIEEPEVIELKLFPNPANEFFMVQGFIGRLQMFDINGKQVKNLVFALNRNKVTTDQLQTGIYFLNLTTNNKTETFKILIKH